MMYGYTTLFTDWNKEEMYSWRVKLIYTILFFIPRANPDQEKLYPQVSKWFLELDDDGLPLREIGIDKNCQPLFAAPNKRNFGFWTDCSETVDLQDITPATKEEFEVLWQHIQSKT